MNKIYKSVKASKKIEERDMVTTINVKMQKEEMTQEINMNFNFKDIIERAYQNFSLETKSINDFYSVTKNYSDTLFTPLDNNICG